MLGENIMLLWPQLQKNICPPTLALGWAFKIGITESKVCVFQGSLYSHENTSPNVGSKLYSHWQTIWDHWDCIFKNYEQL